MVFHIGNEPGELPTIDEAHVGAFSEDALSEADALASVGDDHATLTEASASKSE